MERPPEEAGPAAAAAAAPSPPEHVEEKSEASSTFTPSSTTSSNDSPDTSESDLPIEEEHASEEHTDEAQSSQISSSSSDNGEFQIQELQAQLAEVLREATELTHSLAEEQREFAEEFVQKKKQTREVEFLEKRLSHVGDKHKGVTTSPRGAHARPRTTQVSRLSPHFVPKSPDRAAPDASRAGTSPTFNGTSPNLRASPGSPESPFVVSTTENAQLLRRIEAVKRDIVSQDALHVELQERLDREEQEAAEQALALDETLCTCAEQLRLAERRLRARKYPEEEPTCAQAALDENQDLRALGRNIRVQMSAYTRDLKARLEELGAVDDLFVERFAETIDHFRAFDRASTLTDMTFQVRRIDNINVFKGEKDASTPADVDRLRTGGIQKALRSPNFRGTTGSPSSAWSFRTDDSAAQSSPNYLRMTSAARNKGTQRRPHAARVEALSQRVEGGRRVPKMGDEKRRKLFQKPVRGKAVGARGSSPLKSESVAFRSAQDATTARRTHPRKRVGAIVPVRSPGTRKYHSNVKFSEIETLMREVESDFGLDQARVETAPPALPQLRF
eukprot:gnl/Chilomastix_cuspidata/337.p1 GENE.gnl/Chilomastix_cuspidata/337~~gnl/Chilomastix_cuspidata/337.p1  ORF type:complete len:561 (-),score=227.33 gnl/Chilomastix_cuspidata/337:1195-2877(-)